MWTEIVMGIVCIVIGIYAIIVGVGEWETKPKVIGGLFVVLGILMILSETKTDNYTDWEATSDNEIIIQAKDDEYVLDNVDEYLYKVLTYTETGEKIEEYNHIAKNKDTFVEYVEIDKDEAAFCSKFTRENKSVLGLNNGFIQTKYVFYIPTN